MSPEHYIGPKPEGAKQFLLTDQRENPGAWRSGTPAGDNRVPGDSKPSGVLEDLGELAKRSSILALYAAQVRHSDEVKYSFPEAWRARLPNMVAQAIPSEVLDLIEAINTTEFAIPEQEAKQLLIETYENGIRSSLASIPFWVQEQNQSKVETLRKSAETDRLRAEAMRTGNLTIEQALEARRTERSIDNPVHSDNLYLDLREKPLFRN